MNNLRKLNKYTPGHYFIKDITFHGGVTYPSVQAKVFRTDVYPYPPNPIVVGVFGSAGMGYDIESTSKEAEKAIELGKLIGNYRGENNRRMVLLTGFCSGIPHLVAKGAREARVFIVGITAADSYRTHLELLKTTLSDNNAHNFIREQEHLYNIAIFPPYNLSQNIIKLTSWASRKLERLKIELENHTKTLEELCSVVSNKDEIKRKLDEIKKRYETRINAVKKLSKIPSDITKNMLKWRNPLNTELCDISIYIKGSAGTLSEFAMGYHPDNAIIGLFSSNAGKDFIDLYRDHKLTTPDILKLFHDEIGVKKNEHQTIIYSNDMKKMLYDLAKKWYEREESLKRSQSFKEELSKFLSSPNKGKEPEKIWENLINLEEMNYFPSFDRPLRKKIIEPLEEEIMKWESAST